MARICFVCVSLRAGGTERIVSMLANHFIRNHEIDIILLSPKNPFYRLDSRVVLWQFCGKQPGLRRALYYPHLTSFIRAIVKERKPDVLFSFGELISPFVRVAIAGLVARVFVFNRGSPSRSLRGVSGWVNPLIYPFTDGVVVQTEQAVRILKSRYRFCRFIVIPNPVEIPRVVPPLNDRKNVVINIGSIGRLKNQESLINAFTATRTDANWELDFVGDGPDRSRLEALVDQMGLSTQIRFLGEERDVAQLLSNSQIFAFTSLSEGFPNALAEALAAGCACISYDCPTGPSELIEDGINGLLVPTGDQDAFSRGLERLMNEPELRSRLSRAAWERIQQFAAPHIFERFERLIGTALPAHSVQGNCNSCDS